MDVLKWGGGGEDGEGEVGQFPSLLWIKGGTFELLFQRIT